MLFLSKVEVSLMSCSREQKKTIIDENLGGDSEQNPTPMDIHPSATNNEQVDAQAKTSENNLSPQIVQPAKKNYITPKIWMDFEDFCSCFTSVIVFHNPRGYHYIQKHTEVKVKYSKERSFPIHYLIQLNCHALVHLFFCFSSFLQLNR